MNSTAYLHRINYTGEPKVDLNSLKSLHENHIYAIPFENLDVQYNIEIRLEKAHLFKKIVENERGGFCYELNYLFWFLLQELGFDVELISARIFDEEELGPEFDHMALLIRLNGRMWLGDVGFGDLFTRPIEVHNLETQTDGRNFFKVQPIKNNSFLLTMSKNGIDYEKKYQFKTEGKKVQDFLDQCHYKQKSPNSYFVKNKVITLPIKNGRKTIFNSKYITSKNGTKTTHIIDSQKEEVHLLKQEFHIESREFLTYS